MIDREHDGALRPVPGAMLGLAGAGAIALIVGLAAFPAPRPAVALPAYAQQTGLPCGRCHVNPAGGGPRTAFGKAFAANGHKLPKGKAGKKGGGKSSSAAPEAPATPVAATPSVVLDYAQAHAISLRQPYYSLFLYSTCDYSDCGAGPGK